MELGVRGIRRRIAIPVADLGQRSAHQKQARCRRADLEPGAHTAAGRDRLAYATTPGAYSMQNNVVSLRRYIFPSAIAGLAMNT